MNIQYMSKLPDLGRNKALAGKTVSSRGMNISYDKDGYAVWGINYKHEYLQGTQKSVRAASVDAVLNAAARADFDGSPYDKKYFSDKQIEMVKQLRREVASGEMSQSAADQLVEEVRNTYGYSGGASGMEYIPLTYLKQPGEVLLEQQRAAQNASSQGTQAASGTSAAGTATSSTSTVSAATPDTAASSTSTVNGEGGATVGTAVSITVSNSSAPQTATANTARPAMSQISEADAGRSRLMRELFQQQQRQSLQDVLEERRRMELTQRLDRTRITDRLLRLLEDDEDAEDEEAVQAEQDPAAGIE